MVIGSTTITGNGFSSTLFVIKVDPAGAVDWSHVVQLASADYISEAGAMVVESDAVIVAGYADQSGSFPGGDTFGTTGQEFFVVKLDADGAHVWTQAFPASAGLTGPVVTAMTSDGSGNMYIFGQLETDSISICSKTLSRSAGFFGIKLDSSGNCLWADSWETHDTVGDKLMSITANGNSVFVTGTFGNMLDFGDNLLTTTASEKDIFVAALDAADGDHQWSKQFGNTDSQYGQDIALQPSGDIVVTAYGAGTFDFGGASLPGGSDDDLLIARLDSAGGHVESARHGDSSNQRGRAVAIAPSGVFYVTGDFQGTLDLDTVSVQSTDRRHVTAAFHANGTALWAHEVPLESYDSTSYWRPRIHVAPNGDLLVLTRPQRRLVRYSP